jgi:hypothetical protein
MPNQRVKISMNAPAIKIIETLAGSVGAMRWETLRDSHASSVLIIISPITRMRNEYVGRLTFFINHHYPHIIRRSR